MVVDKQILSEARALIAEYQEFASLEASFQAEDSQRSGDSQAALRWRRVGWAIEWLEPRTARPGETIH